MTLSTLKELDTLARFGQGEFFHDLGARWPEYLQEFLHNALPKISDLSEAESDQPLYRRRYVRRGRKRRHHCEAKVGWSLEPTLCPRNPRRIDAIGRIQLADCLRQIIPDCPFG